MKTPAQYKQAERDRYRDRGLVELQVYVYPEDRAAVRRYAKATVERRGGATAPSGPAKASPEERRLALSLRRTLADGGVRIACPASAFDTAARTVSLSAAIYREKLADCKPGDLVYAPGVGVKQLVFSYDEATWVYADYTPPIYALGRIVIVRGTPRTVTGTRPSPIPELGPYYEFEDGFYSFIQP